MPATRTTHRSKSGSKLYAKRNAKGEFTISKPTRRAHGKDVNRKSRAERNKGLKREYIQIGNLQITD